MRVGEDIWSRELIVENAFIFILLGIGIFPMDARYFKLNLGNYPH
jgi:hypothetical protein